MAAGDNLPHVLFVDDDSTCRAIFKSIFMKHSCKVSTAQNELQALSLLGLVDDPHRSGNDPIPKVNMVVIDYGIEPRGSGFELLKKLKESSATKDAPVVFVSADDDVPSDSDKYLKAGAVMFVNKLLMETWVEMSKTVMLQNMAGSR